MLFFNGENGKLFKILSKYIFEVYSVTLETIHCFTMSLNISVLMFLPFQSAMSRLAGLVVVFMLVANAYGINPEKVIDVHLA